ncbi:methyltransferase domain-containing protein [Patescibacteria group bacterium]
MNNLKLEIKLAFISGIKDIVLNEIGQYSDLRVIKKKDDTLYLDFVQDISQIIRLRSVVRAYIVVQDSNYNPYFISKHKSIIGSIIAIVDKDTKDQFKSFKIICTGSDSPEVRSIAKYIEDTYKLTEEEDADMKIHITKSDNIWEVGIQITPRPLSVREYKARNMEGAMDSTIAYAVNSLCKLENVDSYLNVFSGSATLLIEAAQCYPNLKKLIGFDNSKEYLSLAILNIKKAGLLTKIKLKEEDIFSNPKLGKFNVITSDLPFGMLISKYEDLEELYQCFVEYCQGTLSPQGILGVYTSNYKMLKKIIRKSKFQIIKELNLKRITSTNTYLYPRILICTFKKDPKL